MLQPAEGKGMLPIVGGGLWIKSREYNNIMVYLALIMAAVLTADKKHVRENRIAHF